MQTSIAGHSSGTSMGLTASLASLGTGSDVLAVVTCTGGVSGGSIFRDELFNSAPAIDSGSSEAAVVSVAVPVTDSAAVATSALPPAALSIAVARGASVC